MAAPNDRHHRQRSNRRPQWAPRKGTEHMTDELHPNEKLVFGSDAKRHEITGMILEQGSGALSPDDQARRVHLPYIASTQGAAVADAMLIKINAAIRAREILKG
jgi:hypothetical protein